MVIRYTQLLSRRYKGKLDADADEFIAFVVDGATRMHQLIQDLLTYSRLGAKQAKLTGTNSDEAFQQAIFNLRGAIEGSGAQVTHDPLPVVLADKIQLTQLFQNLVGNAIKYQKPGTPRSVCRHEWHEEMEFFGKRQWPSKSIRTILKRFLECSSGCIRERNLPELESDCICKKIVEGHGDSLSVGSQSSARDQPSALPWRERKKPIYEGKL